MNVFLSYFRSIIEMDAKKQVKKKEHHFTKVLLREHLIEKNQKF